MSATFSPNVTLDVVVQPCPGSTPYFVWGQERNGSGTAGKFDLNRDGIRIFRDRPTNIFQLKATYWIGR